LKINHTVMHTEVRFWLLFIFPVTMYQAIIYIYHHYVFWRLLSFGVWFLMLQLSRLLDLWVWK